GALASRGGAPPPGVPTPARRVVGLRRLAGWLERVVLEAEIAQLRDEGADRPAGQAPDRPADEADRAAEQRAASGAPVLGLDELRLAVRSDIQNGGGADLVAHGPPERPARTGAAGRGGEGGRQELAG